MHSKESVVRVPGAKDGTTGPPGRAAAQRIRAPLIWRLPSGLSDLRRLHS
jgi:hypothetical protein